MGLLCGATPAQAVSRVTKAKTLRNMAIQSQSNSLRYLHTTWFNANYRYATIGVASITEATGAAGSTGTIELLRPAHGFSTASSDQFVVPTKTFSPASATQPSIGTTRRQASAMYATALALGNGTYNEHRVGVSRAEALRRTVAWTNALALSHARHEWGGSWQSALWTYYLGAGSKRIWSDLPTCTQELVTQAVAEEADRLVMTPAPFYKNARGKIVYPGDSKSEENAWNATLLFCASRMYGSVDATRAAQWEAQGRCYALTAYATPSQVGTDPRIQGSNLNPDGTVINRNKIHPDYMATAGEMQTKYVLTSAWTHTRVAPECGNGLNAVWHALTKLKFPVRKFMKPGGTIYRVGAHGVVSAGIYYPQGSDWSKYRRHDMALMDVTMFVVGKDAGYNWARAHIGYLLNQQARHKDGSVFSKGETRFTEEEQFAAACSAEMVETLSLVR